MKITLRKGLLLFAAVLGMATAQAQTVSGTISDANGPLPGASVLVKGTTNGTQSDFDGNYSLSNVSGDATLVVSYIGFKTAEISVNGRSTINVVLEEDLQALDEVVIIGYGATTVKDATGAVAAVTSDDFNVGAIASPEQLIQGKVAGVQISSNSGEPGAGIALNIRGSNSIRSNNNPLYVVDGVPLSGESNVPTVGGATGGNSARNPLNFINPNDIESISILKDASATAIYGSRGANGVVIITTKSGKTANEPTIEYSSSLSVSSLANGLDLLDRDQFLALVGNVGGDVQAADAGSNTDWIDFISRTAASQNQNISYSSKLGNGHIRATLGYGKQFGIIKNSSFERITGRINATQRYLDDKLTLNVQASVSRVNDEAAPLSSTAGFRGDLIGAAYSANPTWPADPNYLPGGSLINPAVLLSRTQTLTNTERALLNASLEYEIADGLKAKVNAGYDESRSLAASITNATDIAVANVNQGQTRGNMQAIEFTNRLLEATLSYNKTFGAVNVDALAGYSFQSFARSGTFATAAGFASNDLSEMRDQLINSTQTTRNSLQGENFQQFGYDPSSAGSNVVVNSILPTGDNRFISETVRGDKTGLVAALAADRFNVVDDIQSYFARVNLTIADKYLVTGTMRADGSSRFGPANQYGYFPSGAVAWKLSEEDFMGDAFSTLKLRAGAGVTGNQEGLGHALYLRRERFSGVGISDNYDVNFIINGPGVNVVSNPNPDLKWESTISYNAGIDFGFNDDKFSGSIDVYQSTTDDQIIGLPAAAPAFGGSIILNLPAEIENKGVELALNNIWASTEDMTFSTAFNISYNENLVTGLNENIYFETGAVNGPGLSGAYAQRLSNNVPLFSFYMAEFTGFDSSGFPTYADVDGNGVGDPDADKKYVDADALPDVNAGLSLNMTYKNWDFSSYFTGQFGFYVYNGTANAYFTKANIVTSRNVTTNVFNEPEAVGSSLAVSTRFLEKGDFIRWQNASIGYNVPLSGDGVLDNLRLSLTGQNLLLFTDYSGVDPEVSAATGDLGSGVPTSGIDYNSFPRPRTITFGINARF